jgi:hypothetical protein
MESRLQKLHVDARALSLMTTSGLMGPARAGPSYRDELNWVLMNCNNDQQQLRHNDSGALCRFGHFVGGAGWAAHFADDHTPVAKETLCR